MKKAILTAFILFITLFCIAQISYENRIEFELKDGYKKERVIEFGENGFVLYSKKSKTSGDKTTWRYELFDTDLKSVNVKEVAVDSKKSRSYLYPAVYYTDTHIHSYYKDKGGNYTIVSIEAASLAVTKVDGKLPAQMYLGAKAVAGDYIFLEGLKKKHTHLLLVNWKTGEQKLIKKILNDFDSDQISVIDLQTNEDKDEVIIHVEYKKSKKKKYDYLAFYDVKGNKTGELNFNSINDTEHEILRVSGNKFDNQRIIAGTYGKKKYSYGVFFSSSDGDKINFSNTYNFTDLDDFFGYMSEKTQDRIEKIKDKKEEKGKELNTRYLMVMHKAIPMQDGYLVIGEAYYPTYYRKAVTDGNGERSYQNVFDGFQYTHATIMKFDYEGNLKWDKSFRMLVFPKPKRLRKYIRVAEQDENSVNLIFITSDIIRSKKISYDGEILQEREIETIETGKDGDKEKWTTSNMIYWYDNYFIVYGSQKIKNKKDKGKRKRKTFFVSKIKYE